MISVALPAGRRALLWRLCGLVGLLFALSWPVQAWFGRFELSQGRLLVPLFGAIQAVVSAAFGWSLLRRGEWSRPLNIASLIAAALALVVGKSAPSVAMAVHACAIWLALRLARPRS